MARVAARRIADAVIAVGVIWAVWAAWPFAVGLVSLPRHQDAGYAADVFAERLPVAAVLASRKWHPVGGGAFACTFAIVRLADAAPVQPPSWDNHPQGWQYDFGGDWRASPAPVGDITHDVLAECGGNWPEHASLVQQIATEPGHWYSSDRIGEKVHLYSQTLGIAARIRFGD